MSCVGSREILSTKVGVTTNATTVKLHATVNQRPAVERLMLGINATAAPLTPSPSMATPIAMYAK
jgi:hypothetical protein